VHGTELGDGFADRVIPVTELRAMLLHPACDHMRRQQAWIAVVNKARGKGGAWMIAAVGLVMPGLKRVAARIPADLPCERAEVEQEMLAAVLEELARMEMGRGSIPARLCAAADRAMHRIVYRVFAEAGRNAPLNHAVPPPRPFGHPDFVLRQAVTDGVISESDAELIGRTRLEGIHPARLAVEYGITLRQVFRRRARAEEHLATALHEKKRDSSR
jgi:hypothetical protein